LGGVREVVGGVEWWSESRGRDCNSL